MKIAWFTPFAKESAIGYYSKLATEAIHNSYEVDIWVSNRDGNNLHPSELNVVRYTPDDNLEKLLDYDCHRLRRPAKCSHEFLAARSPGWCASATPERKGMWLPTRF